MMPNDVYHGDPTFMYKFRAWVGKTSPSLEAIVGRCSWIYDADGDILWLEPMSEFEATIMRPNFQLLKKILKESTSITNLKFHAPLKEIA